MPNPIVVSVPHSGTRFIKDRLGVRDHVLTNASWTKLWAEVEGRHLIVPLRSPADVWRSWCRRWPDKEVLNWAPSFFVSWTVLHTLDQLCELDVICIDEQKDPRITDWRAVGDQDANNGNWKLHKVDLRALYKLPIVYQNFGSWAK